MTVGNLVYGEFVMWQQTCQVCTGPVRHLVSVTEVTSVLRDILVYEM